MAKPIPTDISDDVKARFWAKVDVCGPSDCWHWHSKARRATGKFTVERQSFAAPRLAWSFSNAQPFPEGLNACHTCDNPSCCNPAHIWPGTQSENIKDCVAKGRHKAGRKDYCSKGHFVGDGPKLAWYGWDRCLQCRRDRGKERVRRFRERLAAAKIERGEHERASSE